jgi:excisionase family DNA binding protein
MNIDSLCLQMIQELIDVKFKELKKQIILSQKSVFTLSECSDYTGLSNSCLYKLTSTKMIPFYCPRGKMVYFQKSEIDAWLLTKSISNK